VFRVNIYIQWSAVPKNAAENSESPIPFRDSPDQSEGLSSGFAAALENVINATVQDESAEISRVGSALAAPFHRIADEFQGQPLTVEPVLVALIDAVTQQIRVPSQRFRQRLCRAVAETIFNDSAARQRMEKLWHSIQGRSKDV
jgi:hypothetical protein